MDKTKEELKQHVALIEEIKKGWGGAGVAVDGCVRQSGEVIKANINADLDRQKKQLADMAKELIATADEMVRARKAISGPAALTANFSKFRAGWSGRASCGR